jgi:hypothetical protein
MGQDRSHTVEAAEISDQAKGTPAFTFEFEVFRTSTFVILKDAAGSAAGQFEIASESWDALIEHSSRVRSADKAAAAAEDPRMWEGGQA